MTKIVQKLAKFNTTLRAQIFAEFIFAVEGSNNGEFRGIYFRVWARCDGFRGIYFRDLKNFGGKISPYYCDKQSKISIFWGKLCENRKMVISRN